MILPGLFISGTANMGKGVFTAESIAKNTIVEISPVIVMSREERKLLDQTLLHDYIFEWGTDRSHCCVALGYVSVYNHAYQSNCEYEMDYDTGMISIKTIRYVEAGSELFINYNGVWNNPKPLWFDAK